MAALLLISLLGSCKKDKDNNGNPPPSRNVKYEITGNYSGHLLVVINDGTSTEPFTVTSLPWTKEKTYASSVLAIGIGGQSVVGHLGQPGQTVTVKIYAGGTVVKNSSVTAGADGVAVLPNLAYSFQ